MYVPGYLKIDDMLFKERIKILEKNLSECTLCPNECRVNRMKEKGRCKTNSRIMISSFHLHYGEEPPISGKYGSGTIFFSGCPSSCVYCQNFSISQLCEGYYITVEELAAIMVHLQNEGAHNINLVTPTHFVPQIISAIFIAKNNGLNIPVVYNTFGYEKVKTLRLIDGIIDIYMPDMRYSDNKYAERFSGIKNYVEYNRDAVKEMQRQVGDLIIEDGIAKKGLLVRLLVLPNNISGTIDTLKFLYNEISKNVYISLMCQYYPAYKAMNYVELNRFISKDEYYEVYKEAKKFRGHFQHFREFYDL